MANISENAILSYGKLTDGTKEYNFQTSSIYKSVPIASATGVQYIAPGAFPGTEPLIKIEQLVRSGKLVRLNALVANPVEGKKNKTIEVLCDAGLAISARTALIGKTLQITKGTTVTILGKIIKIRGRTQDRFS